MVLLLNSVIVLAQSTQTSSSVDQLSAILPALPLYIFFLLAILLSMPGIGQRFQISLMARGIEQEIERIGRFAVDAKMLTERLLKDKGVEDAKGLTEKLSEMFIIDPVSVEPTDIISRMRHLLRSSEDKIRNIIIKAAPNIDPVTRSKIEVSAEITNALNIIYKILKHYLILAKKLNSLIYLYQLQNIVPIIVKYAEAYVRAQKVFLDGIPVGDSLGPLVASRFILNGKIVNKWSPSRDTVAVETEFEGRKLIIVKAEGPMATVGTPGEAVANVIEKLGGKVARIITVDAALRLESETTGIIAEGTGVAMGDPGPEKIAIERVAVKYGIPIDAIIVKMSMEEAITEMRKEIYQAADKVVEMVKKSILERTNVGDTVILVGVGNTVGVAQ
ncbi:MAG: DUF1512 domain-containing protein [Sulfolobaceae archaeon]